MLKCNIGLWNPASVEVYNRQGFVEYKLVEGYADEKEVRSSVGNIWRGGYDAYYSGFYSDRKEALDRIQGEIDYTEKKLEELKFAMKVLKKKDWRKVEEDSHEVYNHMAEQEHNSWLRGEG